jgi:hypothetical protein
MNRGKFTILVMMSVAVTAASFASWYRWRQGGRSIELWGTEAARLIRFASRVELWELTREESDTADRMLAVEGRPWWITRQKDISRAPGLIHARHALLEDASFLWNSPPAQLPPRWKHALRFSDRRAEAILLIDVNSGRMKLRGQAREIDASPIAAGLRQFFDEQL